MSDDGIKKLAHSLDINEKMLENTLTALKLKLVKDEKNILIIKKYSVTCPYCEEGLGVEWDKQKFCNNCGEKLTWEE